MPTLNAHAESIARTAGANVGIGWEILIPIAIDVAKILLPELMSCLGPNVTPAQALGYNAHDDTFSVRATRRAMIQVKHAAKRNGQHLRPDDIDALADAALREAMKPTDLAACAAEAGEM